MTPLESATTPPGKLWGVAVAMGARLVPIGAMRHVAGVCPGPAFLRLAQGHTICENTPFSGLPTVIDKRFAGGGRAHGAAALGALGSTSRMGSHAETCASHSFCLSAQCMLQMGVQVTFAWLGPLRVLSGVLITGWFATIDVQLQLQKKNFVGWAAPLLDRGRVDGWPGRLALAARRRGEARCVHSWHVGGGIKITVVLGIAIS